MRVWIWRWAPAVLVMVLIFIASALPGSELPDYGSWDIVLKKGGHLVGYALLAAAFYYALSNGRNSARCRFVFALVLIALYAASDEWHQKFTPGRNGSPWDVCIDVTGGCIGLALWCLIRRRLPVLERQTKATDSHEAA